MRRKFKNMKSCIESLLFAGVILTLSGVAPLFADSATVLAREKTFTLENARAEGAELWVTPDDLTKVTGFVLKPEGACLEEVCIPVEQDAKSPIVQAKDGKKWLNLTAFAKKLDQGAVYDADKRVLSLAPLFIERGKTLGSGIAPDFTLPDRTGKPVSLSDFKGKKVFLFTWASWCGCRFDLPGWQAVYTELKGKNFEMISVAEDTGGEAVAGRFWDTAKATYTTLIDAQHTISTLYNMVNVPAGVWIDEEGRIARPPEVAYSKTQKFLTIQVDGDSYVAGLRDWVEKGDKSVFAMKPEELKKKLTPRSPSQELADANFKLAVYFHGKGEKELAEKHWKEAQRLFPDDWNFHRQDWAFTPDANKNWMAKFQALNGKPYYEPLELPKQANAKP